MSGASRDEMQRLSRHRAGDRDDRVAAAAEAGERQRDERAGKRTRGDIVRRGCCAPSCAAETTRAKAATRITCRPGFIEEIMKFDTVGDRPEFRAGLIVSPAGHFQPEEMSHALGLLAHACLAVLRLRLEPERLAPRQPQSQLVHRIAVAVLRMNDLHRARIAERELGALGAAHPASATTAGAAGASQDSSRGPAPSRSARLAGDVQSSGQMRDTDREYRELHPELEVAPFGAQSGDANTNDPLATNASPNSQRPIGTSRSTRREPVSMIRMTGGRASGARPSGKVGALRAVAVDALRAGEGMRGR